MSKIALCIFKKIIISRKSKSIKMGSHTLNLIFYDPNYILNKINCFSFGRTSMKWSIFIFLGQNHRVALYIYIVLIYGYNWNWNVGFSFLDWHWIFFKETRNVFYSSKSPFLSPRLTPPLPVYVSPLFLNLPVLPFFRACCDLDRKCLIFHGRHCLVDKITVDHGFM